MTQPLAHPDAIISRIEAHAGNNSHDPYWARIEALMRVALNDGGDPDQIDDARLLRQTTGGVVLETAARHVGFVLGVEYAQRLMKAGGVH
jgi:metal-dependent hydrolase (beta-lactamase superfamily II)